MKLIGLLVLGNAFFISAQSLLEAISLFPQLSDFRDLLNANPTSAPSLLTNLSSSVDKQTSLVPSNAAFENYRQTTGQSVSSLSSPDLKDTLDYHSLQGALSSSDTRNSTGLLSNTALSSPKHVNRGLESNGARKRQVVLIQHANSNDGSKIQVRTAGSVDVKSGKGREISLNFGPGNWSGGYFYIVDGSVIALFFAIQNCKTGC